MRKRILIPLAAIGVLSALYAIGAPGAKQESTLHAQRCVELKGDSARCDKVIRSWLSGDLLTQFDKAMARRKSEADAAAARQVQQESEAQARAAEERNKAEQQFRAEGWNDAGKPGIYWRWCPKGACSADAVIGDNRYVLMQVWCKERACGDIYARVNLLTSSGVVVGWTNDTGYGDTGQIVQLTFDSHQDNWDSAQLTELNLRG